VLLQAVTAGASDVHFETDATTFRVRCRLDGLLHTVAAPALSMRDAVLTRLKVLARMDIAEKRLPQDGRIDHVHGTTPIDLRVSSLPTLHGEKLVVRILRLQQERSGLAALGFEADELARLHHALAANEGLILITGPTGSGKTLSLYNCLDHLNCPEVNITTLEDPVEIQLPGINQVSIHERVGLGFARALRSLLRQDPDIVMLGEIRDTETAEIALQAAQTGHLVLTTLHTQDAPRTLLRLQHMGLAPYHVAASVRLIVAQRLVRCLCPHCRTALSAAQTTTWLSQLQSNDLSALAAWLSPTPRLYEATGCAHCHQGYRGRIGVFQVMAIDDAMHDLVLQQAPSAAIAQRAAKAGVRDLRQSAWVKALQGLTSPQEALAHTPT